MTHLLRNRPSLVAGASPSIRDAGRGLRAEQWARFCGRYICAEVIEKFARHRMPDRSTPNGRWGSEPELAGRILTGKVITPHRLRFITQCSFQALPPAVSPALVHSNSIKNKLRRAFRTTSSPGTDCPPSFSIVTQLTSAALCASSPLLPTTHNTPIKPMMRPISVPRLQVSHKWTMDKKHPKAVSDNLRRIQYRFSFVRPRANRR